MSCLPKIKNHPLLPEYFPTLMQAFIFRNWETVDKERIASVLETSVENVSREAERMGLGDQKSIDDWTQKGYITTIRSNWHLLNYEQLTKLLGWSEDELAMILKEEDFLDIKLGSFKPECDKMVYRPLTEQEIKETEKIRNAVCALRSSASNGREAFDFWSKDKKEPIPKKPREEQIVLDNSWIISDTTGDEVVKIVAERFANSMKDMWHIDMKISHRGDKIIELSFINTDDDEYHEINICDNKIEIKAGTSAGILRGLYRLEDFAKLNGGAFFDKGNFIRKPRFKARYIYSFCGLYQNALDVDSSTYCPDSLLEEYARVGVNGIWLQAVLYRLVEFPFAPEMSEGWKKRLKNLKNFADRAEKYGIKIYMYINEPRTMPLSFFDEYPQLKGAVWGQYACMCVSEPQTRAYLHDAIQKVCNEVPNLGGLFTITMSENLTHCKSRKVDIPCEKCKDVSPWELVRDVNSIVAKAAHGVNPKIKVIAWDWAWTTDMGMNDEDVKRCIEEMPEDIIIMAKREAAIPFTRGGISGKVSDYSISVEGISEKSRTEWKWARESNHEIAAKVQINNSWECSTTPYLPVYRTLYKHMEALAGENVNHLMLSWTLGGYPSPSIRMLSETFFIENGDETIDFDKAVKMVYGEEADKVKKATDIFCEAFGEFPFDISVLYVGPQNGGVSNRFYNEPTGYRATMTCYAYDNVKDWSGIYPVDILEQQYKIVSEKWEKGLKLLCEESELWDISYISYSLFRASYNQTKFVRLRDEYIKTGSGEIAAEIVNLVSQERALAYKVYEIMCRRPEVGFEAANHYYYSKGMIAEKIINCDWLIEYYSEN